MKILFLGTPEFALPSLNLLVEEGWEIGAVVTRPDCRAGRGRRKAIPPVKRRAEELGIEVWQPVRLTRPDFQKQLKNLSPELIVGVAYGKLIPPEVLACAVLGGINLHPSLLPRYRGAAPVQWALLNGESVAGVTVLYLSEEMDAGDILGQETVGIHPEENARILSGRLALRGARLLARVAKEIREGKANPRPQDESRVSYAPRLTKEDGKIDWGRTSREIFNLVRGLYPWPGAYTLFPTPKGDKLLKIIESRLYPQGQGEPGKILAAEEESFVVAAGEGALKIIALQLEGHRPLTAGEFLRGQKIQAGQFLGQASD